MNRPRTHPLQFESMAQLIERELRVECTVEYGQYGKSSLAADGQE